MSEDWRARLEEIRRAKELEARKRAILMRILSPEARQRLTNIKMVRPELAAAVEDQLIILAQQGRIKVPVTDEQLKRILELVTPKRRRTRIRRI